MDTQLREQAQRSLEKNVEENLRRGEWHVYERYEIISDKAGNGYIWAPELNRVKRVLRPLSRESADLFLRFAGWVEEFGMDKELGSPRNVEAALTWAGEFGVLGLNPPDMSVLGLVNSQRVTADYLGMPWLGRAVAGHRNTAHGGRPNESVENFAFEAWEAHVVLSLYESVRSQELVDADTAVRFMSPEPVESWTSYVERDLYSQDPELTRLWALTIVEDAVNRKVETHCYPTIQGAPGSYEKGLGGQILARHDVVADDVPHACGPPVLELRSRNRSRQEEARKVLRQQRLVPEQVELQRGQGQEQQRGEKTGSLRPVAGDVLHLSVPVAERTNEPTWLPHGSQ